VVTTRFGPVACLEAGQGPAALFVHGVFLNADLWRHQLDALGDIRRCVAVDLLGHGQSPPPTTGAMTIETQVEMIVDLLDRLGIDQVDLVGNDSGGAIAQLVVAHIPDRVRSLVLTNCDTHDNWPPEAFRPIFDLARSGELAAAAQALAADPAAARTALASGFEDPDALSDQTVASFFAPFADRSGAEALQTYVAGMDSAVTVAIEADLARFDARTLIVWGTGDEFFDVRWAHWLAETIPGTVRCVELEGAKLFFPLERTAFTDALRTFWSEAESAVDAA
jgi:pimeloyl-ACP methyl ester carboxylesterase